MKPYWRCRNGEISINWTQMN